MRDRPNDKHRTVAEQKIGRRLQAGEDVDHANSDKTDNSPANLNVMKHGAHSAKTNRERVSKALRDALSMVKRGEKRY